MNTSPPPAVDSRPILVLHSAEAEGVPAAADLQSIGLIGQGTEKSEQYGIGPKFFGLINFLGCSPNIPTEAGEAEPNALVRVERHEATRPKLLAGRNAVAPRCPLCRRTWAQWRQQLSDWRADTASIQAVCPNCNNMSAVTDLHWRHQGGLLRHGIVIRNIFPSEAVPSPELIDKLNTLTGTRWDYFYYLPE